MHPSGAKSNGPSFPQISSVVLKEKKSFRPFRLYERAEGKSAASTMTLDALGEMMIYRQQRGGGATINHRYTRFQKPQELKNDPVPGSMFIFWDSNLT